MASKPSGAFWELMRADWGIDFSIILAFALGLVGFIVAIMQRGSEDIRKFLIDVLKVGWPIFAVSEVWGLWCYLHYAANMLESYESSYKTRHNAGFHELLIVTLHGLIFALVFRAQHSAGRWWEARGHLGMIIAKLKIVFTECCNLDSEPRHVWRVAICAELFFACIEEHLMDSDGISEESRILEVLHDKGAVVKDEASFFPLKKHVAGHEFLEAFHGCSKVKSEGARRQQLAIMEVPLMSIILGFALPADLASGFHGSLMEQHINDGYSLKAGYIILFCVGIALVDFFYIAIKKVSDDAAEPFGHDYTDIRIVNFRHALYGEIHLLLSDTVERADLRKTVEAANWVYAQSPGGSIKHPGEVQHESEVDESDIIVP